MRMPSLSFVTVNNINSRERNLIASEDEWSELINYAAITLKKFRREEEERERAGG